MYVDTEKSAKNRASTRALLRFHYAGKRHAHELRLRHRPAAVQSSCATADFAAVMAIAARTFRPFDRAYADRCLAAARKAWAWVGLHPNVLFRNPPGVNTGEYGDSNCADERLWAAAELWRTTGDAPYESYFLAHYAEFHPSATQPQAWADVANLALWT